MHRVSAIGLFILFVHAPIGRAASDPAGDAAQFERLQNRLAEVADEVRPSVVAIRAERRMDVTRDSRDVVPEEEGRRSARGRLLPAIGTGTIISADGLILTNEHVIRNAGPESIECILHDGQRYTVEAMTTDPRSDLAVLKIAARNLKPARLGDLSTVRQGHFAIVLGNPYGTASDNGGRPAMSFGVVSAIGQDLTQKLDVLQQHYYGNLIQTDARINPGNSGGPLLNLHGEVIGVTTAISTRSGSSEGVGYAISLDKRVKDIIARLARGEEVTYGMIGVRLEAPTEADRLGAGAPSRGGAVVRQVEANTPASVADLRAGDVVTEYGEDLINDVDQLIRLVGASEVGTPVRIVLYRGNQRLVRTVTPVRKDVLRGVRFDPPFEWKGMRLVNPTPDVCEAHDLAEPVNGVVVSYVAPGGAAERAGIQAGQVLIRLEGEPVRGVRALRDLAARYSGTVKIALDGQPALELTLP